MLSCYEKEFSNNESKGEFAFRHVPLAISFQMILFDTLSALEQNPYKDQDHAVISHA